MDDSDTFQAILEQGEEKGQIKGVRRLLLLFGRKKLGEPDDKSLAILAALNDLDRLESLAERIDDVSSWQELLATPK